MPMLLVLCKDLGRRVGRRIAAAPESEAGSDRLPDVWLQLERGVLA
jgi:hypothetical protein